MSEPVKYEFFRNATAKLTYAGKTFLLDPMLSNKGELPSFAGIENNPTVELPANKGADYIIAGIDAVLVSHMHMDHFDAAAADALAKDIPIITPDNEAPIDPHDPVNTTRSFARQLGDFGFTNVTTIGSERGTSMTYHGIEIIQEFALHGTGQLGQIMGGVNGIILRADGQPTIYWTSDTIVDVEGKVADIVARYRPDIIIAHTGGAMLKAMSPDPILMNHDQAMFLAEQAREHNPGSQMIAVHMDSLDHCFTTRTILRERASALAEDIRRDLHIPEDGEIVVLTAL